MMAETGKMACWMGFGKGFEIREYPVPDPEPGAVVIKVSLANVCGSDMHYWKGEQDYAKMGRPLPLNTGHEHMGTVYKLGAGVTTDTAGEILTIGRATPVWNRAIRRAMTTRSPHCQWPGCETPAPWCDAHHFQHWEHGGATSLENGVHLCRRHHVFLHQHRDWTSTFDHQHLRVFRADGTEVHPDPWHLAA